MVKVIYTYVSGEQEEEDYFSVVDAKDAILEKWFENDLNEMIGTQIDEYHWVGSDYNDNSWEIEIKR